ncbi:hypothetical protein D3C84_1274900 [compost metagenome]
MNFLLNEPKDSHSIRALRPLGPWRRHSIRAIWRAARYRVTGWKFEPLRMAPCRLALWCSRYAWAM